MSPAAAAYPQASSASPKTPMLTRAIKFSDARPWITCRDAYDGFRLAEASEKEKR